MSCPHGVYSEAYCQICNSLYPEMPFPVADVHLPQGTLPAADVLRANPRIYGAEAERGKACPACGSPIYARLDSQRVECGDCGHQYKKRRQAAEAE